MFMESLWVMLVSIVIAYGAFIFFGSLLASASERDVNTVTLQDTLMPDGSHRISGMIMMQSECEEIQHSERKIRDGHYQLTFLSWKDPARNCEPDPTPRHFSVILFVEPHSKYQVVLNKNPLPVVVYYTDAI